MGRRFSGYLLTWVLVLFGIAQLAQAQIASGPAQLERCDEGLFSITFANPSPTQTACQIVVQNTLPGADYSIVPGSGRVTVPGLGTYNADPVLEQWAIDAIVGGPYELPPAETLTVQFSLATSCLAVSGTDLVRIEYVECSQPGVPLAVTDSVSIEILPGAMTLRKTPASPAAGIGDLVTWTLAVNSTGLGSIKNVVVTDTLGAGLDFVSAAPAGQIMGQTIVWSSREIPSLADIDPDDSVTITLVARVVACADLDNRLDGRFGCSDVVVCGDTETQLGDCGCAPVSSVQFIQRLPFLEFSAPAISIPYCATTTTVTIPIENSGDGTAHDALLCPSSLGSLIVSNVQGGASYVGGCFQLPDIHGGTTFNLTFDVTFSDDWCAARPSGTPLYTLEYVNDCGVVHRAQPRFGSIGASAAPGLSLSKTGPSIVGFGNDVTYRVTAQYAGPTTCGAGTTGIVTVTDTIPAGFTVVGASGGVWTPGTGGTGGTVEWTFDPAVVAASSWDLIVRVPLDCDYCYTEQTNTVSATAVSCCGCVLSAAASVTTAITCDRLYTSLYTLSSTTLERCGDAITITDEHPFADDAALDTIAFSDFEYAFLKENGLEYVPGSATATIDGVAVPVTVVDDPDAVRLSTSDAGSVRARTLTFTYQVRASAASAPACGEPSSFYVWTSHEIPEIGPCTLFYDTARLTIEPAAMSASIAGVPTIQEDCATYPVTLTFRRTSALAAPYDARLVLTGTAGVIADFAGATWSGVSPVEPPIVGPNSVEWRFADGFASPGASASVTVPVTTRCGGPLIGLAATGTYDDLCNDSAGYNDTCQTSAAAASSLRLSGDVYLTMTPEVIYTTVRSVTWRIELYNSSNGTAYNVYVDDVLGSGLAYTSSTVSGYTGSLTTRPNQDHSGAPINGASFLFGRIGPGERPVIQLTADLVSCTNMTNVATVGWGCGGDACQPLRSDSSFVLVAPANVVSTSLAVTPTDVCAIQKATMTLRSAGIATAYNLVATTTLPTGLVYAGNPEYRVSGGAWNAAGDPSGAPGPGLTWTRDEVALLAAVAPGITIDIRFDVEANCGFNGGITQARTSYENPCGQTFLSGIGTFSIATRKPTLSVTVTQTTPAAGQPIACDGQVTWQIRVTNSGPAAAEAVWTVATLGAGLTYASSTGGVDGGASSGQTVTWEIQNLGAGSTATLTVTADATSCAPLTNSVRAYWACGPDGNSATMPDCISSTYASGSATATRAVSVSVAAALSPSSIASCEPFTTLTLTLTNASTSAPAYSPDVRVTLPAGLTYRPGTTEIRCGSGFTPAADPVQAGQVLTWYSTTSTGPGNDLCATIPASGSVAVRFQVGAACYRTTASATINTYYYDCCGATQYQGTSSASLTASAPALSFTMTPSTATLDCANALSTVTWTLTVTNTGSSAAGFVRVIDTLGADLVRVSGGTQIGANGQQWGWEFGPLAPGGSQSVQLVARLAAPPNDCADARRTSTAVTSWGCTSAALDGDPNTTAEYSCTSSGGSVTRTATVLVPDLSISSSDLVPQFTCASDGISSGRMQLTVRNSGTAAVSTDFAVSFSESTTGWSGSGTFTSLGGTLPLAAGGSQVLTLSGWPIACSSCSYTFTATLDAGGTLCECRENNNTATLSYTPTVPDLVVASSALVPTCAGDGQVRIQGTVTLRNQGCGTSAFTTNVPMRFTVYAGNACSGTVLDQWTQTFTGVNLAAGGGIQAFAVDRTTTFNACSPCQLSILAEADYANAICECSGTNNALCAGPLAISFPDLVVSGISFAGLACAGDAVTGSVAVTVTNQGCGAAGAFNVGLSTSGCLTFAAQRVAGLAAGTSTVVSFPIAGAWNGCATCGCTFTATVDTSSEVCECNGANNTGAALYTSPLPDLVITSFVASAATPCQPGSAQVTVRNAGCGIAPAGVVVSVSGAVTGQAATSVALAAGESETMTVPFANPVGCGTGYAVTASVDPSGAVCECNGANNAASTTFSVSAPDLAVSNVTALCNLDDTFTVTATVANAGGQPASDVSIRVYADGTLIHSETQSIAAGSSYALSYVTPPLLCATPHAIRVVADEVNALCECAEGNNEATVAAATCPCPALSTEKTIVNVWRGGASAWPVAAVETGDVIEYQAVVTNNGAATAFHVDLTDTLPAGLIYTATAPGHDGQYTLSAGGSGTFSVPVGATTFTTSIHATLPLGQSITLRYCARVESTVEQGDILTNVASADGQEGSGRDIPAGADSATIPANRPGLSVDKTIADVVRGGVSLGIAGPVEPGDVIVYRFAVRNVGAGSAYGVSISDVLPAGLVIETAPPGSSGAYTVSAPASSGSLGLTNGATSFTAPLGATLAGGATLTATYAARVTSAAVQGTPLVNVARAAGTDRLGAAIPASNAAVGDTSDDDAEDPDADDTGIASIQVAEPALSVDKQVVDVIRGGTSLGVIDPVLYGDVVVYRLAVRNVGLGTAYRLDLVDTLPPGIVVDTSTAVGAGTYTISAPAASGGLALADGASSFATSLAATLRGGGTLIAQFAARVTTAASPAVWLTNTASAAARDGADTPIPGANPELGDTSDDDLEDPDADDTGVALVRVGIPALVTDKSISRIVRAGREVTPTWVEAGDIVTYALVVRNVGQGPALEVALADILPPGFVYHGATTAAWPTGSSTTAPSGAPGPALTWMLDATLAPGEQVELTFEALVLTPVRQDATYTNTLRADGRDAAGAPILADASALVPEDTDEDDESQVTVPGARPALVTEKRVADIVRDGRSLGADAFVTAGDVVVFELIVTNVGRGTAYAVNVRDDLPTPFTYVAGSTAGQWPTRIGTYTADPAGAPGPLLAWAPQATLAAEQTMVLRFSARAAGPLASGAAYRNVLTAQGLDGVSSPIPLGGAPDVPRDDDDDDRDDVSLVAVANVPALVTQKSIVELTRAGARVVDDRIEIGDVITYELVVENVGPATAYEVRLTDELPREFAYILGSGVAMTPTGTLPIDPTGSRSSLQFDLSATLARGQRAVVRFDAAVVDPLIDARLYFNDLRATGRDASGAPIPADQSPIVPADVDEDDASSVAIRGRSWLVEGSGGLVSVPILRKTAETLGVGGCSGLAAETDRVWFQTDIAMLAASEFAETAEVAAARDIFPDTLLPTWGRTVRAELGVYALENLLQVQVLSSIGVGLERGPRILDAARGAAPDEVLARRLAELARVAGTTDDDVLPEGRWIYLEAAAGEPVFQAQRDSAWGASGTWTVVDEDLVASSLGMGLVRQAQAAARLVASPVAAERYLGWVLAEAIANKLLALDRYFVIQPEAGPAYVPHASRALEEPDQFETLDRASMLFDQASLLWGAARVLAWVETARPAWPTSEQGLAEALVRDAGRLLERAAAAITAYHTAIDGRMVSRSPARDGAWTEASTVDLGVLLAAVEEALPTVSGGAVRALRDIQENAARLLVDRQGADGRFREVSTTAGVSGALAAQFAGMLGLLASDQVDAAARTFQYLEDEAWNDWQGFGLYRLPELADLPTCYTALDMGLAVGALRELAHESDAARGALIERRLAALARTVLDDAALQLDNAGNGSRQNIAAGDGRGAVFALRAARADALAPVLQRSLCLVDIASETSCGGLRILAHDPWYQTDIAMYAASVLQAGDVGREDDADANLIAVDFHAQLGVRFDAWPELADVVRQVAPTGAAARITPIAIPFFAGNPHLGETAENDLTWNAASFDARVVPSALGMTMLREAQEATELGQRAVRSPEDEITARVLAASLEKKLDVLEQASLRGPNDVWYMAHEYKAVASSGSVRFDAVDRSSDLFDQASLLLGLTEVIGWARALPATHVVDPAIGDPASLADRAGTLVRRILDALERAHHRAAPGALADRAVPGLSTWTPGDEITLTPLGILAEALEKTVGTFGHRSPEGATALALLDAEVAFVETTLWDGSGGYLETWSARPDEVACQPPTLAGQLAALRALLAAQRLFGAREQAVRAAALALDARFWDPTAELYVGQLDRLAWCMTPLDLALAVGVLPQAMAFVDPVAATQLASRLGRHVDRALDAMDLQIPARSLDDEGREQSYAPVFDRRVCLEPVSPLGGITWTRLGDRIRYEVSVENPTEDTFVALVLTDTLPEGVALLGTAPAASSVDGRRIEWTLDRLEPGARGTWRIDVRALDAPLDGVLTNCASLMYTDEDGVARPTREVCVSVTLGTADAAREDGLRSAQLEYRTDEAMRLAWTLDGAADRGLLGATTHDAREASRANLGILLGESGLGVSFALAAPWTSPDEALARLAQLAADAGLPGVPTFGSPIFLPTAGGVPILERGAGFLAKSPEITPAALGWTLAREVAFLDAAAGAASSWDTYLAGFVSLALTHQVAWLEDNTDLTAETPRLVHAMEAASDGARVVYTVSDPRELAYDAASLLVGLARVAGSSAVAPDTARRAAALGSPALASLARYVSPDGLVASALDAEAPAALWFDIAVVARALDEVSRLPQLEQSARALLGAVAGSARHSPGSEDLREEAARIAVLLIAGRALGDRELRQAGLAAWRAFAAEAANLEGLVAFSAAARIGWRYTPAELALAFDVLDEVARADLDAAPQAAALAAALVRAPLLAEQVQLWTPIGYWRDHTGIPCVGGAPVFSIQPGPVGMTPLWTLRRP